MDHLYSPIRMPMSKGEELIDDHVSLSQCWKAVEALHSHETKKKEKFEANEILPAKEEHVWLNVAVKTISTAHKLKPHKIPIIHPLVDPRTTAICLITKDPQREYKDLLESHNIKFISRVVGIAKLKGKFKAFEARRMLLKENGLFLADERVIPLLPKLLGSKWFEAKKQPIPVCLTRKDLKAELERAISSTYLHQNRGTCTSIKIGKLSQEPSQILDNIKASIPNVVKSIKGGWDNIQALTIKTNSSISLPIWSCTLEVDEGSSWHGIQAKADDEMVASENEAASSNPKLTSRKRQSSDEEEERGARKKVKPTKAEKGQLAGASASHTESAKLSVPQSSSTKGRKAKVPLSDPLGQETNSNDEKKSKKPPTVTLNPLPPPSAPSKKTSKKDATQLSSSIASKSDFATSTPPKTQAATDFKPGKKKESKVNNSVLTPESVRQAKPTLSRGERKQKHSSGILEKKKRLVTKVKGGKSAKHAILGKKSV